MRVTNTKGITSEDDAVLRVTNTDLVVVDAPKPEPQVSGSGSEDDNKESCCYVCIVK